MTRRLANRLHPVAALALSALAACVDVQSALHPSGIAAERIATLWWVLLALGGVVWLVVTTLVLAAVRGRRRGGDGALRKAPLLHVVRAVPDASAAARPAPGVESGDEPSDEPGLESGEEAIEHEEAERRGVRWIVLGGVVGPAVILLVVFAYTIGSLRALTLERSASDLEVEVVAHQWWWEVRYLDPVPANIVTSANELHVPVGRRVRIRLRSSDVIHSFWVPRLAGKVDLVPGTENLTWIRADSVGAFRGQCAEFCGVQHAHMAFLVVAHEPDEFERWIAREREPAAEPAAADTLAREGRLAFEAHGCALCHSVRGTRASAAAGPDLTHFASRRTIAAGTLPNVRGYLAGWIADPQAAKPGNHMPRVPLGARELNAIVAYLETLR